MPGARSRRPAIKRFSCHASVVRRQQITPARKTIEIRLYFCRLDFMGHFTVTEVIDATLSASNAVRETRSRLLSNIELSDIDRMAIGADSKAPQGGENALAVAATKSTLGAGGLQLLS